jgi:hypothetical protein
MEKGKIELERSLQEESEEGKRRLEAGVEVEDGEKGDGGGKVKGERGGSERKQSEESKEAMSDEEKLVEAEREQWELRQMSEAEVEAKIAARREREKEREKGKERTPSGLQGVLIEEGGKQWEEINKLKLRREQYIPESEDVSQARHEVLDHNLNLHLHPSHHHIPSDHVNKSDAFYHNKNISNRGRGIGYRAVEQEQEVDSEEGCLVLNGGPFLCVVRSYGVEDAINAANRLLAAPITRRKTAAASTHTRTDTHPRPHTHTHTRTATQPGDHGSTASTPASPPTVVGSSTSSHQSYAPHSCASASTGISAPHVSKAVTASTSTSATTSACVSVFTDSVSAVSRISQGVYAHTVCVNRVAHTTDHRPRTSSIGTGPTTTGTTGASTIFSTGTTGNTTGVGSSVQVEGRRKGCGSEYGSGTGTGTASDSSGALGAGDRLIRSGTIGFDVGTMATSDSEGEKNENKAIAV